MIMIVLLTELAPYSWNRYGYVSDALSILEHRGVSGSYPAMEAELSNILPYESYNFTLVDFGTLTPLAFCSNSTFCASTNPSYPECVFYLCGKKAVNVETGDYQVYSSDPSTYCSDEMISKGSCKPEGDLSQRLYVDLGTDDLVDHFYILRLEVAR